MSAVEAPTQSFFGKLTSFFKPKTPDELTIAENSLHESNKKKEFERHTDELKKINPTTQIPQTATQPPAPLTQSNGSGVATTTSTTSNGSGVATPAPASAIGGRKSKRSRRIKRKNTKRKR